MCSGRKLGRGSVRARKVPGGPKEWARGRCRARNVLGKEAWSGERARTQSARRAKGVGQGQVPGTQCAREGSLVGGACAHAKCPEGQRSGPGAGAGHAMCSGRKLGRGSVRARKVPGGPKEWARGRCRARNVLGKEAWSGERARTQSARRAKGVGQGQVPGTQCAREGSLVGGACAHAKCPE